MCCPIPLGRESFVAVVSNATLHHLPDAGAALRRLSELVRPGGTLAIVGFTRTEWRANTGGTVLAVPLRGRGHGALMGGDRRPAGGHHGQGGR
jgi:SAM-dependent methyltransferase